jgi:hypothetical protein
MWYLEANTCSHIISFHALICPVYTCDCTDAHTVRNLISGLSKRIAYIPCSSSFLAQKPEEGFGNDYSIMLLSRSIQSVPCLLILKNTLLISGLY